MPVLKNARHEAFAQALAKGMTATDAYLEAGYKGDRTAASRLSTNVNIASRVDQIKNRVAEKAEWTAADRLSALKTIFDGHAEKDARVAISAIAEANKMQGSYAPAKRELSGPGGGAIPIDLTNVSADDLERLEALFGPLAGGPGDDDEGDTSGEGSESSGS
ncbi:phage terminase small subunit [Pararhizobium capsulatum DSM 1112]|uniref:Phage terminase small subunit n=1 Tax=Pararhizobium capsulatum DSM 1112 TaxID=1121113 RepID=A0ABU0BP58_9HYPH|nr:terminase small subunit [Pararhizobium capsulatum]MDQ0320038.1 phage terminase small subunit [Pararhizobium capsulatum DSM 1112]